MAESMVPNEIRLRQHFSPSFYSSQFIEDFFLSVITDRKNALSFFCRRRFTMNGNWDPPEVSPLLCQAE